MKRQWGKKTAGVVKGAPSGFVISLGIHAVAFFLAGLFVVFTVAQREEKKFVPPKPVDRPKMKLKKPKVKVKKSSKPKATQRIVTRVQKASMPDIQLPEMSGIGDGIAGDIGGFEIMPNLDEVTLFGGGHTIGNDFIGTFYDFKRDRRGSPVAMDPDTFVDELRSFVRSGFKTSKIARYYRSPKKLYATTFMIPPIRSSVAPSAFDERETIGYAWAVHYKGRLSYHEDIKFRFWGMGDDVMVVRVDGEVVLNASWPSGQWEPYNIGGTWQSSAKNDFRYYLGNNLARGGDWIELKAGEAVDMDVIIGEVPGGMFCSMLTVEVEGETYEKNRQGGPIHPIFKTTQPSLDLQDAIYRDMVEGEADVLGGPVFRDYVSKTKTNENTMVETDVEPVAELHTPESSTRIWTMNSGKTLEADYISFVGGNVILKSSRGKQAKVPFADLSPEDQEFVELSNPPKLNITFTKGSKQRFIETTPFLNEDPPRVNDWTFGAKVKQTSSGEYKHPLTVEFYAIGQELIGRNYILLDRQESTFTPTRENKFSHAFSGNEVEFMENIVEGQRRGKKYVGNLVTVTDKTGKIIQYSTSSPWLWEHIENLEGIPVGRYMDKTCTRVHPSSPKATRY